MTWLKIARLRKTIANFLGGKRSSPRGGFQCFIAPSSHFVLYWSWSSACKLRSMQPRNDYFVYCKFNCFYFFILQISPSPSIYFNFVQSKIWHLQRDDNEFKEHNSWFHYLFFLSTPPFLVNLINFIKTAVTPNDQHWLSN